MAENIDAERAAPCPLCQSPQVQICRDANNPAKDYCRCRECKCSGPLAVWNRRTPSASIGEDGLPELPDGDEYSATRMLQNGQLAPRYTAATMRQYASDAVAADRRTREVTVTNYGNPVDKVNQGPQAAQGVKTWFDRAAEASPKSNPQQWSALFKASWMLEEITDLRAQLARQSQGEQICTLRVERGYYQIFGERDKIIDALSIGEYPLYAAPPLSSEQQAAECVGCEGKPSAENNPCAVCGNAAQAEKGQTNVG